MEQIRYHFDFDYSKYFKHRKTYNTIYYKWHDMNSRCYNPKNAVYKYYGERGISVCDEWRGKQGFENFCKWVVSQNYDENKNGCDQSIDRINNNENYEPNNCRLVDKSVQNSNKRTTNKTGYCGVQRHHTGLNFYATLKINNKDIFICCSKSKNECARLRNEYIIKNNLYHKLNEIKEELEEIIPTKKNIYYIYDKENNLLCSGDINCVKEYTKLSKTFITQCCNKKRNSKLYEMKREEKLFYDNYC